MMCSRWVHVWLVFAVLAAVGCSAAGSSDSTTSDSHPAGATGSNTGATTTGFNTGATTGRATGESTSQDGSTGSGSTTLTGGSNGTAGKKDGGPSSTGGTGTSGTGTSGTGTSGTGTSGTGTSGTGTSGTGSDASTAGAGATGGGPGGSLGGTDGTDAGAQDASSADARTEGSLTPAYDALVLSDHPVAYWAMNQEGQSEPDLTGNGNVGTYEGGAPAPATLPNGDRAADFDGSSQYLTVRSSPSLSIPTTGSLTWEAWIRPDVLQFPNDGGGGYVDWMGKCASYSPSCEWEARMYDTANSENRCNRLSAYVFNPSAGLGSAADWQPECGLISSGQWYHVVGEYTTASQPADCPNASAYPGSIDIWVDGVEWSQRNHDPTGCMSQYEVVPKANDSPLNIGTMALDTWFRGAIGKVAIYDYWLGGDAIVNHYRAMVQKEPAGSCADSCTL